MKKSLFAFVFISLIACRYSMAQYPLKKIKTSAGRVTETTNSYWYTRNDTSYNGIAIRAGISKQKNKPAIISLQLKYTCSIPVLVSKIKFIGNDSTSLTTNLIYLALQKTDDAAMNTRIYRVVLNTGELQYLTLHKIKALSVVRAINNTEITIPVYVDNFLIQQLNSLQKL